MTLKYEQHTYKMFHFMIIYQPLFNPYVVQIILLVTPIQILCATSTNRKKAANLKRSRGHSESTTRS